MEGSKNENSHKNKDELQNESNLMSITVVGFDMKKHNSQNVGKKSKPVLISWQLIGKFQFTTS